MFVKDGQPINAYSWVTYGEYSTQPINMDAEVLQQTGITVVDDPISIEVVNTPTILVALTTEQKLANLNLTVDELKKVLGLA